MLTSISALRLLCAALAVVSALVPFTPPALAQKATDPAADALIGFDARFVPAVAENGMVSAQEKVAAQVGADILKAGGNAIDAAVAVGFAMAVTHPQAGNIGGGGFMLITLADGRKIALDYRETAPAAATRDMFLDNRGAVDRDKARYSRASAGVPGTVAGLLYALEKYGTMPRDKIMAPAIRLAEEGVVVPYGLAFAFSRARDRLKNDPSSARYFLKPEGEPYRMGEVLRQPDLAKTLRTISERGAAGFYEGEVAELIATEMKKNGGLITEDDLKAYKPVEREPVRGIYNGYEIVSMPPPSSGGVHVIQMLNILEGVDLKALGSESADTYHRLIEAMRRAYADRAKYLGDPDFVTVPVAGLTNKAYAAELRKGIDLERAARSADVSAGKPPAPEGEQTTHFSVMDKAGNAVANTYTLNLAFGSGYSVDGAGFLLNNEMDDFSAKAGAPNAFGLTGDEANAIEPKKRPLSSMAPTIVMKDGAPYLITGSPGGSTIITVVLQEILNVLTFDMNVAEATAAPRIHHQWMPDNVITERGVSDDTLRLLEARGFILPKNADGTFQHRVLGRANSIMKKGPLFLGAADLRDGDSAAIGY
ncbi:gamma-glutamyltransferase [Rhodomicrobium vannielii ATCC 17100]|uniref:Glutathione hydrolase proenzyme n=1 Tax=Rhodomicrobium vannielii (strain ATCC 17100 / DSM 162 / LMG 4299 / NCIMB 10020 / ATH 3.1.1) TaxID=648757 RepID=E3I5C5_RHOVT|nr:gamma-glutamyltransferase [Rhodomicrobium vannielii]ADP71646.1 gamma-glutamyltransferase [Rhodomicrobium vannielii ATCC 17100]